MAHDFVHLALAADQVSSLNEDVAYLYQAVAADKRRRKFPLSLWDESRKTEGQAIEQVWLTVFHSEMGGPHPEVGLLGITLKCMLDKARERGLRLWEGWVNGLNPDHSDSRPAEGDMRLPTVPK